MKKKRISKVEVEDITTLLINRRGKEWKKRLKENLQAK